MHFPNGRPHSQTSLHHPREQKQSTLALSTVILRENHTARLKGNREGNHCLVEILGEDYRASSRYPSRNLELGYRVCNHCLVETLGEDYRASSRYPSRNLELGYRVNNHCLVETLEILLT